LTEVLQAQRRNENARITRAFLSGVADGARTHDNRNHNLRQASSIHAVRRVDGGKLSLKCAIGFMRLCRERFPPFGRDFLAWPACDASGHGACLQQAAGID
jgi:hypothetical protein